MTNLQYRRRVYIAIAIGLVVFWSVALYVAGRVLS